MVGDVFSPKVVTHQHGTGNMDFEDHIPGGNCHVGVPCLLSKGYTVYTFSAITDHRT